MSRPTSKPRHRDRLPVEVVPDAGHVAFQKREFRLRRLQQRADVTVRRLPRHAGERRPRRRVRRRLQRRQKLIAVAAQHPHPVFELRVPFVIRFPGTSRPALRKNSSAA